MLNKIYQSGIPVWNIRREGAARMTLEIRAKHFCRLRALKRGARCRIHILKRRGMPFFLARLRHRKLLAAGACAIALLLFFSATRVWFITVEGCERVPEAAVLRALDEAAASIGMARADVVPIELGSAIRNFDSRIAWAGVQLDGVALRVQVKEAEPIPELPNKDAPADIIAAKDGLLEKITALNGKAAITPGNAVRAGDILIRGDITREGAQERMLVHAQGEAEAIVYYTATVIQPATEPKLMPTGTRADYRALLVAGYTVYESAIPFSAYSIVLARDTAANGLLPPIRVLSGEAMELSEREVPLEPEDQLAEALYQAEYRALEKIPKEARILDKAVETERLADGSIRAEVRVRAQEQIGVTRMME